MERPPIKSFNLELNSENFKPDKIKIDLEHTSIDEKLELISWQFDLDRTKPRKLLLKNEDYSKSFNQDDLDIASYSQPYKNKIYNAAIPAQELTIEKDHKRRLKIISPTFDESLSIINSLSNKGKYEVTIASFKEEMPKKSTFSPYYYAKNHMLDQMDNMVIKMSSEPTIIFVNKKRGL